MKTLPLLLLAISARAAEPQDFLGWYNSVYVGLSRVANEAAWRASTDVSDAHEGERTAANTALQTFLGDRVVIETAKQLLAPRAGLSPVVARQLDKLILAAGEGPGTIPEITAARVAAESRQASLQDGFVLRLEGKPVSANEIDRVLAQSLDLGERQRAWEASKQIGKPLGPGLVELQRLRNQVARAVGQSSYFALEVADYDMTVPDMMALLDRLVDDTRPLFRKLHAWVRRELAKRYHQPVPTKIPAHWIANRWAQEWDGLAPSVNLDPLFKDKKPEWIVETAERFWTSLGFASLPKSFWVRSDLYPVAAGGSRKKNSHASAWHVDLNEDVRSLMSVEPNEKWFRTSHHELGHIYYYRSYTQPEVPPILRQGLSRAMHEAIGDLAAIASTQEPYLRAIGVVPKSMKLDARQRLLDEALTSAIPFVAWSAGTMAHFEYDLYEKDLPASEFNARWWKYVGDYQGVASPTPRDPAGCDACSKTHINDNPAQYYNYAIATVIKYQLHDHICRRILQQDPHSCNYFGRKEVGAFLGKLMALGATRPWREVIREATGEELSSRALASYFQSLEKWLDKELRGQPIGW